MPARPEPILDPYRTLGLEAGASSAEVKRAYRRLAKTFHPDSAGEQAVPRFLAIQAAYDQIRTGRVTLGGSRGTRAPAATAAPTTEPWRADPDRARAARERARRAGTGTGARAGTAGGARTAGSGAASGAGASGGQATGGRKSTGTSGSGGSGGRKRATRKATMGSTSYDEARDPADATWSGASWYGPSTGEYWIVNPREYADPRKHGPDYQQRARRPLHEWGSGSQGIDEPATMADAAAEGADAAPEPTTTAGSSARLDPAQASTARDRRARPTPRWSATATESGWAGAGEARPSAAEQDPRPGMPLRWLAEPADDPVRRFGMALVAWPPLGLAAAAFIGQATGCSTFGAGCDGADAMLPWLAQPLILGMLLLLPPLTRVFATGTVAVLVALVPITAFLVAFGATGAPEAAPTLAVLLGVAWMIGLAGGITRQLRPGRQRADT